MVHGFTSHFFSHKAVFKILTYVVLFAPKTDGFGCHSEFRIGKVGTQLFCLFLCLGGFKGPGTYVQLVPVVYPAVAVAGSKRDKLC